MTTIQTYSTITLPLNPWKYWKEEVTIPLFLKSPLNLRLKVCIFLNQPSDSLVLIVLVSLLWEPYNAYHSSDNIVTMTLGSLTVRSEPTKVKCPLTFFPLESAASVGGENCVSDEEDPSSSCSTRHGQVDQPRQLSREWRRFQYQPVG